MACTTPFKQSPPAKILDVYSASPSADDASSLLGGDWWTSAPTFLMRPLNQTNTLAQEQYSVIRRYFNVGTAERWTIRYRQLDKPASASSLMTNVQDTLGAGTGGKNVGDQALYYQEKLGAAPDSTTNGAPYESATFIRVGALIIQSEWLKGDGFPSSDQMAKVAARLVSGVKNAVSGKVQSAAASDSDVALLPPPNAYITPLGAVRLPVQALPLMLNEAAPTQEVNLFHAQAVDDFVYGDYALNTDTGMEVQAAVFTFSTASGAAGVFDSFKGASTVDANGVLRYFNDVTGPGQYDYFIVSGRHLGLLICRASAELTAHVAASRSCESSLETVATVWPSAFTD